MPTVSLQLPSSRQMSIVAGLRCFGGLLLPPYADVMEIWGSKIMHCFIYSISTLLTGQSNATLPAAQTAQQLVLSSNSNI